MLYAFSAIAYCLNFPSFILSFHHHHSNLLQNVTVRIFPSMADAIQDEDCCENVWAVISMENSQTFDVISKEIPFGQSNGKVDGSYKRHINNGENGTINMEPLPIKPLVTIRMHPAAIPDTRNFKYVPATSHLSYVYTATILCCSCLVPFVSVPHGSSQPTICLIGHQQLM